MEEKEKIFAARAAMQSTAAEDTAMAKAAMERMAKAEDEVMVSD